VAYVVGPGASIVTTVNDCLVASEMSVVVDVVSVVDMIVVALNAFGGIRAVVQTVVAKNVSARWWSSDCNCLARCEGRCPRCDDGDKACAHDFGGVSLWAIFNAVLGLWSAGFGANVFDA
jgi:hypothetical protein